MRVVKRLLCAVFEHKYRVIRYFTANTRQVGCARCKRSWAMNDEVRVLLPWDKELEDLHRSMGHIK